MGGKQRSIPGWNYLLSLEGLVDGEVPVAVHVEQDDFAGVVEPRRSRHVNPLVRGGDDGGDGVTWTGMDME